MRDRRGEPPARRAAARAVLAVALAAVAGPRNAAAKVYLSRDEALRLAFGEGARIERATLFLTEMQLARARELAGDGVEIRSALLTRYAGHVGDRTVGTAYFDTHRVRTLQETVMVVVTPEGRIGRIEILSFGEPQEYLPHEAWLEQFPGRALDRELRLERGIHGITGATLSARAVTEAARRALGIHLALSEVPSGAGAGGLP